MTEKNFSETRLCPFCANSIDEHAAKCNFCKADLSSDAMPNWLKRGETGPEPRPGSNGGKKFSIPSQFIWPAAIAAVGLAAFFAGSYVQRSELSQATQANLKQLQAKDQMIQSQEAQLAQTRQQLNESSTQLAALKSKLEESRKELSSAQQRLTVNRRQAEQSGSNANRSAPVRRAGSRPPDAAAPAPGTSPARRTTEAGVYETTQATAVYESPSSSARVVSQIGRGTRINVVSSAGTWLEVRSRQGNPPGFVRAADARQVARAN
jgi:hypothetical protein